MSYFKRNNTTVSLIAKKYNCRVVPVTYKFQGFTLARKGFDIVDAFNNILLSVEPINPIYSKNRWIYYNRCTNEMGYLQNTVRLLHQELIPGISTGWKLRTEPINLNKLPNKTRRSHR